MGKRQVYVVAVPKAVTAGLLVVVSAAILTLLYLLSGKAYAAETHPLLELVARLLGTSSRGPVSRGALLAFLMPVIANILLFVPWGFLMFLVVDRRERRRRLTYGVTVGAAILFAAGMFVWQHFLPTRVTSLLDIVANTTGALAGAALGHARKVVRVQFDF